MAAKSLPKWLAKECMRRYEDFIKPSHKDWTQQEDDRLLNLYMQYGPKWAFIAKQLQARSD